MKTRFFLIIGCILLAGIFPGIAVVAFGMGGMLILSVVVIAGIIFLLS